MNIRSATKDDLETIISMGEQLQDEARAYEPLLTFDRQASYDHYAEELKNADARIAVVVDDLGIVVGYHYCYISTLDYLSSNNRECVFEALYVKLEHRGKGVATMLVQAAEQWALEMSANRIKANIYTGNIASENMHSKNGFTSYCTEYIKLVG